MKTRLTNLLEHENIIGQWNFSYYQSQPGNFCVIKTNWKSRTDFRQLFSRWFELFQRDEEFLKSEETDKHFIDPETVKEHYLIIYLITF